jgi:sec-independent protein translocase protein TatA
MANFRCHGALFSLGLKSVSMEGHPMFEGIFQPMHLMVIAGIALLIFGPKKLPEFGKGLGEGIRGFKSAMQAKEETSSLKESASAAAEKKRDLRGS